MKTNGRVMQLAKIIIGIFVAAVFIWLAFSKLNWNDSMKVVAGANYFWVVVGFGMLALDYVLRILRWWLMLRFMVPNLLFGCCVGPFLASIALNNILPFRAGDIVRVVGFCKQLKLMPMQVLGTMIIERLLDLAALLAVFFITLKGIDKGIFPESFVHVCYWLTCAAVLFILFVILMPSLFKRCIIIIVEISKKRSWRFLENAGKWLSQFIGSLTLIHSRFLTVKLLVLSLGIWLFEGAMFAAIAKALLINNTVVGSWFSLSTGTLATLIPSTPGYVGTFDYFTMLGIMAYGVPQEVAAVFALVVHIVLWLPITIFGMLWLVLPAGKSVLRTIRESERVHGD